MINHNEFLRSVFDKTISVEYRKEDFICNYSEADLYELWKVLQAKKVKYPMIWLQTGYQVVKDIRGLNTELKGLKFFFITLGSKNEFYKDRFVNTFQEILFPVLDKFLEKIRKTSGIHISDNKYSYITLPFNSVSELENRYRDYGNKNISQTTTTPDVWDAIVLDINLTINNECSTVKPFKIK